MKRFQLSLLLSLLFLISCTQDEQKFVLQSADPAALGFDKEQLAAVNDLLEEKINDGKMSGAVVMILKDGTIAMEQAWGWSDLESDEKMRPGHLFRIASMTKAITSTAILQLVEKGEIRLDDPLEIYIPEFADPVVLTSYDAETGEYESRPAAGSITIHHLLTHTSGISYGFNNNTFGTIYANAGVPDLGTEESRTIGEVMATLGTLPLAHDPGERYTYSLSTDVLGRVVEVASGMTLSDYFHLNIFDPLGMEDTGFYLPGREDDLTTLYSYSEESGLYPFVVNENVTITPDYPVQGAMSYYSGGAGLTSTARDYAIFLNTLLNGGILNGSRILGEESWQMMIQNQVGDLWGENKFGYGLMITTEAGAEEGRRPAGSLGWGGAYQTTYWIDPSNQMVVVLMTQVIPSPYRDQFFTRFEEALYSAL